MSKFPRLNMPPVKLRASRREGSDCVWDDLRGCWLVLTPEEWVRRHVVALLTDHYGIEGKNIIQEYPVCVEGMPQRADVVVNDTQQRPLMLIECKCAQVTINSAVLEQAVRYNSIIGARYIMLTNGLRHYFYVTYDGIDYSPLNVFPELDI